MATHAQCYTSLDLPRPARAALPLLVLAACGLGFLADARLPVVVGLAVAALFGSAAAVRALVEWRELCAVRRTADRLIVHAPHSYEASELILWRSGELTAVEARERLVREFDHVLRQLDPGRLPSSSPLRRVSARKHEALLRVVAARIGDEKPVAARGLLLARELLRNPGSPLYAENGEALLARSLSRILGALEP